MMRKRQAKKENAKRQPEVAVATPDEVAAFAYSPDMPCRSSAG